MADKGSRDREWRRWRMLATEVRARAAIVGWRDAEAAAGVAGADMRLLDEMENGIVQAGLLNLRRVGYHTWP